MILALLLLGCNPFENNPPKLVRVNGIDVGMFGQFDTSDPDAFFDAFFAPMGEPWEVTLEISDPEGHDVRVWWPYAQGGWDFDPDGTTGVWNVPLGSEEIYGVNLTLEDTAREPELASYVVPVFNDVDSAVAE